MTSASANKASPTNPFVGKTLGERYRIDKLIGRGGMGLVHLATETKHGREVVIKMLAPHWADDKNAIARFEREGLRLAQLTHLNIVELFDIGHEDGLSYIVMEFIRGEPLRRFLSRRERLTLEEFLPLADQILAAVAYAHSRQMMLRDIKPSNIMLTEADGNAHLVKMLDFGLAKLVDGDDVEITKAHVIGTAGYLAPEQIKGEPCDVRVDVYALGILFFVMLGGKSPIRGENDGAVLYNHVHGKPLALEALLPDDHKIPEQLIALIHQCMEKDPQHRPLDAADVAAELRRCAPAPMFDLPESSEASRASIDNYWEAKFNPAPDDEEDEEEKPTSAEWTRPHLRKLLEGGGSKPDLEASGPPQPPKRVKTKTKPPREKTRVGLPATAEAPMAEPAAQERRPKPARTAARARMDAPTQMMESKGKPVESSGPPELPAPPASSTLTGAPRPLLVPPIKPRKPPKVPTARPMPKSLQKKTAGFKPPVTRMPPVQNETDRPKTRPPPPPPLPLLPVDVERPSATSKAPVHEPRVDPALLSQSLQVAETPAAPVQESTFEIAEPPPQQRPLAAIIIVSVILATVLGGMVAYVIFDDGSKPTTTVADANTAGAAVKETAEEEPTPKEPVDDATPAEPTPVPAAAAEPTASADAGLGALPIEGPEGAVVYVDGEKAGRIPTHASMSPGKHTISVEASGYLPWETEVDVVAGDNPILLAEPEAQGRSGKYKVSRNKAGRRGDKQLPTAPLPTSKPSKKKDSSRATPDPLASGSGKPAPASKPAAPKAKPPKSKKNEDVFMKPGSKGKTKDDGIFLPVGK